MYNYDSKSTYSVYYFYNIKLNLKEYEYKITKKVNFLS